MDYHTLLNVLCVLCLLIGAFFFFGTAVGVVRFPDLYTRIHAASKGDTLSTILLMTGFAIYNLHDPTPANVLVSIKILFIMGFIFITSPTAGHVLTEAAYMTGAKPWTRDAQEVHSEGEEE